MRKFQVLAIFGFGWVSLASAAVALPSWGHSEVTWGPSDGNWGLIEEIEAYALKDTVQHRVVMRVLKCRWIKLENVKCLYDYASNGETSRYTSIKTGANNAVECSLAKELKVFSTTQPLFLQDDESEFQKQFVSRYVATLEVDGKQVRTSREYVSDPSCVTFK
jgi:hypothetical protein